MEKWSLQTGGIYRYVHNICMNFNSKMKFSVMENGLSRQVGLPERVVYSERTDCAFDKGPHGPRYTFVKSVEPADKHEYIY